MTDTTPVLIPAEDWTAPKMAKLARELALQMKPDAEILADFNLTPHEFVTKIRQHPFFKRAYEATCIEWNSALKTGDRAALQALTILEDGLHKVGSRMTDKKEPLSSVVQLGSLLAKMGGLGEAKAKETSTAEKFSITINLGAGQKVEKVIEHIPSPALEQPNDPQSSVPGH